MLGASWAKRGDRSLTWRLSDSLCVSLAVVSQVWRSFSSDQTVEALGGIQEQKSYMHNCTHFAKEFVSGAQINTTLQTLELNSNVIDYDGITALAEALAENSSLTTLHIRCVTCFLPCQRRVCVKAVLPSMKRHCA